MVQGLYRDETWKGRLNPQEFCHLQNLQKTGTRTTLIDNFLCSPKARPLLVSCLNAQQGWLKLGIRKSNLTCRLARNWTDNLSNLQDLPQWSSVRTSDEQLWWTCLGYSVLSQSWWGLLRSFLALRFISWLRWKEQKGHFSVQQLQLKQQEKKKLKYFSFLYPTFVSHSWGVPSPQSKPF